MMNIQAVQSAALQGIGDLSSGSVGIGKGPKSGAFDMVMQGVASVDAEQATATSALSDLASGRNVDLHGTFTALEKADISLRAMVSVRNRVVAAYEQVMNMAL